MAGADTLDTVAAHFAFPNGQYLFDHDFNEGLLALRATAADVVAGDIVMLPREHTVMMLKRA
jgi:hypothetical protein